MVNIILILKRFVSSLITTEIKEVALSEINLLGKLYRHIIFSNKQFAAVIAVQSRVGTAIRSSVKSQTAVNMYLFPYLAELVQENQCMCDRLVFHPC